MPDEPLLRVQNVTKHFGPVAALTQVSVDFWPGEVHAVLGENGAGKSTLMNVMAGFLQADSGAMQWRGQPLPPSPPDVLRDLGIAMVHQHFKLVPVMTVAENIALDRMGGTQGRLDLETVIAPARAIAAQLGWRVDFDAPVHTLPVGGQQRVEILKALAGPSDLLILDEPTAVLGPEEVAELIRILRDLAAEGRAVVLIAHKLEEVFAVAARMTILRKGLHMGERLRAEADMSEVAALMVGEDPPRGTPVTGEPGPARLKVENLSVKGDRGEAAVRDLSFEIRAGEVYGIGGVDGNGQTELAEALAGLRSFTGKIERPDVVGLIPQDRQREGLALSLSIEENLWLGPVVHGQAGSGWWLSFPRLRAGSDESIQKYGIKVGRAQDPVSSLSGGNQQKVVVARVLGRQPELVIALNPTRGLDVKAAEFVHQQLRAAASAGAAVVLISTDRDELAALSSRIEFLLAGQWAASLAGV